MQQGAAGALRAGMHHRGGEEVELVGKPTSIPVCANTVSDGVGRRRRRRRRRLCADNYEIDAGGCAEAKRMIERRLCDD